MMIKKSSFLRNTTLLALVGAILGSPHVQAMMGMGMGPARAMRPTNQA